MAVATIPLELEAGQRISLNPVSWSRFELILEQLGESRSTRIAFADGILEIVAPLPEHERTKVLLTDLVKIMLKAQGKAWEPFGSTTLRKSGMAAGVEPDDCFYIDNHEAVIGKQRIDLDFDPPPDLALEADLTSKTTVSAYEQLGVPELWIYEKPQLRIYLLETGKYQLSEQSRVFAEFPVFAWIPQFIQQSLNEGVSKTLQGFEETL
ncbi:MAG: Uma2 family endonuclease [Limnothrix sp.]